MKRRDLHGYYCPPLQFRGAPLGGAMRMRRREHHQMHLARGDDLRLRRMEPTEGPGDED